MRILALAAAALLLAGPSAADKPASSARDRLVLSGSVERAAFSNLERQLIIDYYQSHKQRGRRGLPPGIAKKVARGQALPPGIAKKTLPRELEHRLPVPPRGYQRVVVDGRVVLVDIATDIIHDVLMDIVVAR